MNYRSTPEILSLANSSITNNIRQFQKELHSIKSPGSIPYIVPLKDVFQQADFVAQRILEMHAEGQPLNGIAVLYRSHYQSMELQMELQRRGIPFEMRSGLKFFELAHIKDVMAFLRVLVNSYDELSWKRVMKLIPGIGNVTAAKLWDVMSRSELPFDTVFGAGKACTPESSGCLSSLSSLRLEVFIELVGNISSLLRASTSVVTNRCGALPPPAHRGSVHARVIEPSGYHDRLPATFSTVPPWPKLTQSR